MSRTTHVLSVLALLTACQSSSPGTAVELDDAGPSTDEVAAPGDRDVGLDERTPDAGHDTEDAGNDACAPIPPRVEPCGLNARGHVPYRCVQGAWLASDCVDPDACVDSARRASEQTCGLNGRGYVVEECLAGAWHRGATCLDQDECRDESVRESDRTCGADGDGREQQRCAQGLWVASGVCIEPVRCEPGTTRPGSSVCGPNGRGRREQTCTNNHWLDSDTCRDDDVCVDGSGRGGDTACGWNGRGRLRQECQSGQLADTSVCIDRDECADGSSRERDRACGVNGRGSAVELCSQGRYGFERCEDGDVCRDGEARTGATACGPNGRGFRPQMCTEGAWVDTTECQDADTCADGAVREVPDACGLNGRGSRREPCVEGRFVDQGQCDDPDECVEGSRETLACAEGVEGERERTCTSGRWSLGECACAAGEHRTCQGTCEPRPQVVHVRADATACQDGRSFASAFSSLSDAFAIARAGTEVWVAGGTYPGEQGSYSMRAGVRLLGGFTGQETQADQRNPVANPTLLRGGPTSIAALRVGYGDVQSPLVSLIDGVTFVEAKGCAVSSLTDLDVRDSIFRNNESLSPQNAYPGGAVHARLGRLRVVRGTFVANRGRLGGAIYSPTSAVLELRDSLFQDNRANGAGGAVHAQAAQVTGATFTNNLAEQGGALFLKDLHGQASRISRSWFEANRARSAGGAIATQHADLTLVNSVLTQNRALHEYALGGAMFLGSDSFGHLTHVTIVGNAAGGEAGAVFVEPPSTFNTPPIHASQLDLINSLVAGNTAPSGPELVYASDHLAVVSSLVEGGLGPSLPGALDAAPAFEVGSLELAASSPGVGFGSAHALPFDDRDEDSDGDVQERLPVDYLGRARAVGAPDVGAFERQRN